MDYDAFISYSHAADGRLAPAIQAGLQRFARPWWRQRALRVFRDETGLSANPHLWASIAGALDRSDWFVLLASPEAAASRWITRELEHWLGSHPTDRLLVVVTEGTWGWDEQAGDLDIGSSAVPPPCRGLFTGEPRHLDLRWARSEEELDLRHSQFRHAIADLAAPIHGLEKDELESEEIRQHRSAMRLARGVTSTIVLLLVVAIVTSGLAILNAKDAHSAARRAEREVRVARSRAFTLASKQALAAGRPDTALLLAVEGARLDDNAQSVAALHAAPPHVRGYLSGVENAVALTASGDQQIAAALGDDGSIVRWDLRSLHRLSPSPPADPSKQLFALNRDGSMVATARLDTRDVTRFPGAALKIWTARTAVTRNINVDSNAFGVGALAFDPRADRVAITTRSGVSIIDARTGSTIGEKAWPCAVLQPSGCPVRLAFDNTGARLAIGSVRQLLPNDRGGELGVYVSVWNTAPLRRLAGPYAGTPLRQQPGPREPLGEIGFRGDIVWSLAPEITARSGSRLSVWDVRNGSTNSDRPPGPVVAYSGSDLVAYRDGQRQLRLRSTNGDIVVADLPPVGGAAPVAAFAGSSFLFAPPDTPIGVWNLAETQQAPRRTLLARTAPRANTSNGEWPPELSDDGSTVTFVTPRGDVQTWHSGDEGTLFERTIHASAAVTRALPSPDGSRVVSLTAASGRPPSGGPPRLGPTRIFVHDLLTGRELSNRKVDCIDVSENLLLMSHDAATIVWRCRGSLNVLNSVANTLRSFSLGASYCPFGRLALSYDGTRVAISGGSSCRTAGKGVEILDVQSGGEVASFQTGSVVQAAAFDRPGRTLAIVIGRMGSPSSIEMHDITTGRLRGTIPQDTIVEELRFGGTNTVEVTGHNSHKSGCGGGTITTLFDATTLEPSATDFCDQPGQTSVVGTQARIGVGWATVSGRRGIVLTTWDLSSSSWMRIACAVANRTLSPEEWDLYAERGAPYETGCRESG